MADASPQTRYHLSPLNTSWHNRSMSSMSATSDTTFHSAHAQLSNMELRPLSQPQTHIPLTSPQSPSKPLISPKLEAIKMDRQDSGYSDTPKSSSSSSSPRTSTSSSRRRPSPSNSTSKPKRKSTPSSSRPSTKRNSRSSAQIRTSTSGSRPSIQTRHTTPSASSHSHSHSQQYQFFHFPTLSDPVTDTPAPVPAPPPPPATVQYWTSDSTRRLEYAAIDAASKGVRGFFIRLVPDCILPVERRRTKFHGEEDDESDAGSVRRYRLVLPCEKGLESEGGREEGKKGARGDRGLLRRWTGLGRKVSV